MVIVLLRLNFFSVSVPFRCLMGILFICSALFGRADAQTKENPAVQEDIYANKIRGVVFRRDVETFPSCLGLLAPKQIGEIEALSRTITQCKSQSLIYEEGRSIVRLFFKDFCSNARTGWPRLDLDPAEIEVACRLQDFGIGLKERLKLIEAREQAHNDEIRWLERCLKKKRRGDVCR